MTDEIYLVLFEVLLGILVLCIMTMVGTSTCIKRVVQWLNLKALFVVRSCILMREN